jgi:FkbM family methyltransferase
VKNLVLNLMDTVDTSCPVKLNLPCLDSSLFMYTHGANDIHVSRQIREYGIWEPFETRVLLHELKAGDTFLDVGANIGYYSVVAAAKVGMKGKVVAFEPDPDNFKMLERNLDLNKLRNSMPLPVAVSDYCGSAKLFKDQENQGDHRVNLVSDREMENRTVIEVKCRGLDSYGDDCFAKVDFVKIDTQGMECHVLRGMSDTLAENRSRLRMCIEFWPQGLMAAGSSAAELLDLLSSLSNQLFIIDELGHKLRPVSLDQLYRLSRGQAFTTHGQFLNLLVRT